MKSWYESKTVWVNVLIGGIAGIAAIVNDGALDADVAKLLVLFGAIGNIFLRFLTDKAIKLKRPK